MKKLDAILLVLAISLFACTQANNSGRVEEDVTTGTEPSQPVPIPTDDKTKYLVADSMAGPFKIGEELPGPVTMMKYQMRVEQIARQTDEGPVTESVTIIGESDEDLLWLKPGLLTGSTEHDNTINEIIVLSPKYKTAEGIGNGSTIEDFKKAYPDYHVWYTYVSAMYVLASDSIHVQFLLDEDDYIGPEIEFESEITPLLTSDFKSDAAIKRIRIF